MLPLRFLVLAAAVTHVLSAALPQVSNSTTTTTEETFDISETARDAFGNFKDPCLLAADRKLCLNGATIELSFANQPYLNVFDYDAENGRISSSDARALQILFPNGLNINVDKNEISQRQFLVSLLKISVDGSTLGMGKVAEAAGPAVKQIYDALFDPKSKFNEQNYKDLTYEAIALQMERIIGQSTNAFSADQIVGKSAAFKRFVMDEMLFQGRKTWQYMNQDQKDRYMFAMLNILHQRVSYVEGNLSLLQTWKNAQGPLPEIPSLQAMDKLTQNAWSYVDATRDAFMESIKSVPEAQQFVSNLSGNATSTVQDLGNSFNQALSLLPPTQVTDPKQVSPFNVFMTDLVNKLNEGKEAVDGLVTVLKTFSPRFARDLQIVYQGATKLAEGLQLLSTIGTVGFTGMITGVGAVGAGLQLFQALSGGFGQDSQAAMSQAIFAALQNISKQIQRLEDIVVARFDSVDLKLDSVVNKLDSINRILIEGFSKVITQVSELNALSRQVYEDQQRQFEDLKSILLSIQLQPYMTVRTDIINESWTKPRPDYNSLVSTLDNSGFSLTFQDPSFVGAANLLTNPQPGSLRGLAEPPPSLVSRNTSTKFGDNLIASMQGFIRSKNLQTRGAIPLPVTAINPSLWSDATRVFSLLVMRQNIFERQAVEQNVTWYDPFYEQQERMNLWVNYGMDVLNTQVHMQTNAKLWETLVADYESTEFPMYQGFFSMVWNGLMGYLDSESSRRASESFMANVLPATVTGVVNREQFIGAYRSYRSALRSTFLATQDVRLLNEIEFPFALPEPGADISNVYPGQALPAIFWPGQEDVTTHQGTFAERERVALTWAFKFSELLGLGYISKRYKFSKIINNSPGNNNFLEGLRITYSSYWVWSGGESKIQELVYDFKPKKDGIGYWDIHTDLYKKAESLTLLKLPTYLWSWRTGRYNMNRYFVSSTEPAGVSVLFNQIAEKLRTDLLNGLVSQAKVRYTDPVVTADNAAFHAFSDASKRLRLFASFAFPRSIEKGGNLGAGIIDPSLPPFSANTVVDNFTAYLLANWKIFNFRFPTENTFRGSFMGYMLAGDFWTSSKWITFKDALNLKVASAIEDLRKVQEVVKVSHGGSDQNQGAMYEMLGRLGVGTAVELDPRIGQILPFYWNGLKKPVVREAAFRCNETRLLPDANAQELVFNNIDYGSRSTVCVNKKETASSIKCEYGYTPSGGSCKRVECSDSKGRYFEGQTRTVNKDLFGRNQKDVCLSNGQLLNYQTECYTQTDSPTTCNRLMCWGVGSSIPRKDGELWNEPIPFGNRDVVCSSGRVSVVLAKCTEKYYKVYAGRCIPVATCSDSSREGDSYENWEYRDDGCTRDLTRYTCMADGFLASQFIRTENNCRPVLKLDMWWILLDADECAMDICNVNKVTGISEGVTDDE
ncbi:hypothetical protein HDV05_002746, partial [Chytridiales sp. JEL 0842]